MRSIVKETNVLFIDTYNLYSKRIDYEALMEYLTDEYTSFRHRFAYVAQTERCNSFANFMRGMNFIVSTKEVGDNINFDVELTIQSFHTLADLNVKRAVICSNSLNLLPLFQLLIDNNVDVHVHGFDIPEIFNKHVFARELPRKVLQNANAFTR